MNNTRKHGLTKELLGQYHEVCGLLGRGSYAYVAKCFNNETNEMEAVKVTNNDPESFAWARKEIAIMNQLKCLDPDKCNIVRCKGFFFHKETICLRFELLDQNLEEYLNNKDLSMTEIRAVIQQMTTTLLHLRSMGIIHADLKTSNIMVVDRDEPMKVKLTDFGLAHPVSHAKYDQYFQTSWYRAPEVTLGIPHSEAIDVWSLGLVAAELATRMPLYNGFTKYEVLRFITETQGQTPDHLLDLGRRTDVYFKKESNGQQHWTLKTPEELQDDEYDSDCKMLLKICSLDDLEAMMMAIDGEETGDRHLLLDLIKRMLHLDPDQRIKPLEILQHPFIANSPNSSHANNAMEMINSDAEERTEVRQNSSWYPAARPENNHLEDNGSNDKTGSKLLGQCHKVVKTIGKGAFGCVKQCINFNTGKMEAIKVFKRNENYIFNAKSEIEILTCLQHLSDKCNIVKWNGFFFHDKFVCLNFELLDQSLLDHLKERKKTGLPLSEIRSIIGQMATVLEHLGSIEIIHADMKPANVMIVDRHQHPLEVKLIDFGLAESLDDAELGTLLQTMWYRAPEIILCAPYNEAIDMWSLGIIAAELVMGIPLYPGTSEHEMLSLIMQVQGQPPDHVLDQGEATHFHFNKVSNKQGWSFRTHKLSKSETDCRLKRRVTCLDDLCKYMAEDKEPTRNQLLLVDLIKRMLHLDSEQRIKPQEVLLHPFMTAGLPNSHRPNASEHVISDDDEGAEVSQWASSRQTPGPEDIRCMDESTTASMENTGDVQRESKENNDGLLKSQISWVSGAISSLPDVIKQRSSRWRWSPGAFQCGSSQHCEYSE